jgi:hypothetical protein
VGGKSTRLIQVPSFMVSINARAHFAADRAGGTDPHPWEAGGSRGGGCCRLGRQQMARLGAFFYVSSISWICSFRASIETNNSRIEIPSETSKQIRLAPKTYFPANASPANSRNMHSTQPKKASTPKICMCRMSVIR